MPDADNLRSMYDLFISYAHADDRGDDAGGWVTAFVDALREEHGRFTSQPLKVFFDRHDNRSMDDWEHRIYSGLRHSTLLLAFLSPAYFASPYCRKESELFAEHEVDRLLHGEAIAPIYFVTAPDFDDVNSLDAWIQSMRRRQYFDARPWHPDGVEALRREEVRKRIEALDQQISDRLARARKSDASPTNIPPHNPQFVGRATELTWLREPLGLARVGVVAAVQGLGGIGRPMVAEEPCPSNEAFFRLQSAGIIAGTTWSGIYCSDLYEQGHRATMTPPLVLHHSLTAI